MELLQRRCYIFPITSFTITHWEWSWSQNKWIKKEEKSGMGYPTFCPSCFPPFISTYWVDFSVRNKVPHLFQAESSLGGKGTFAMLEFV